jgi:hypothetical protein
VTDEPRPKCPVQGHILSVEVGRTGTEKGRRHGRKKRGVGTLLTDSLPLDPL